MHAEQLFPLFFSKQMYPHCLFFIYKHAAFYMEAWLCCVANTFLDKIHLYSVIAEDLGVVIINRVYLLGDLYLERKSVGQCPLILFRCIFNELDLLFCLFIDLTLSFLVTDLHLH